MNILLPENDFPNTVKLPESSIFSLSMNYDQLLYELVISYNEKSYIFSNEERLFIVSKIEEAFPERTFTQHLDTKGNIYFQETTENQIACNFYHSIFPFIRCPKKDSCLSKIPGDIFRETEAIINFTT